MGMYWEIWITLQATPDEIDAIEQAVIVYIKLLEQTTPPTQDRSEIINLLRGFQRRYQGQPGTAMITFRATPNETIAFGSAVIGFMRLVQTTAPKSKKYAAVIRLLLSFQKRYLDSLQTGPFPF